MVVSEFVKLMIGFIIIGIFLWLFIKVHLHFSKDNVPILENMIGHKKITDTNVVLR